MKKYLLATTLIAALAAPAIAGEWDPVVAALLKKFPDMQKMAPMETDISVEGEDGDYVMFYTSKWHMTCDVTYHPVKLKRCRRIHA